MTSLWVSLGQLSVGTHSNRYHSVEAFALNLIHEPILLSFSSTLPLG